MEPFFELPAHRQPSFTMRVGSNSLIRSQFDVMRQGQPIELSYNGVSKLLKLENDNNSRVVSVLCN